MRAIPLMPARFTHRHSAYLAAIAGAAAVLSTACADAPTAASPAADASAVAEFPLVAGAAHAAATSRNQVLKVFPTLQILQASQARVSAADAGPQNSPWDLSTLGGPVVTHGTSRNVYVNCSSTPANCWGTGTLTPATFLQDLNASDLVTVANQYIKSDAAGNFNVSELKTTAKFTHDTASINDILSIVFSASTFLKRSGYNNIFHVFLPKGTNMCIDASHCYAPDSPAGFQFCAFHGSVDFGPNQHVLFSVEPYQFVGGCVLPAQTRVIDGTASTLSHEFMETITDPDGTSWFNLLTGNEIGDLCFGFRNSHKVGSRLYSVQSEYSNTVHACTYSAF